MDPPEAVACSKVSFVSGFKMLLTSSTCVAKNNDLEYFDWDGLEGGEAVFYRYADTVSQEQFQPMMWCTRDFIFENLLSQPYVQK